MVLTEAPPEVDYVESCPNCGMQFVGMTPDGFREEHAPDCDPLMAAWYFTETNALRDQ